MKTAVPATKLAALSQRATSPLGVSIILSVLLLLVWVSPLLPSGGATGFLRDSVAEARGRTPLWWMELRQAHDGYYEALMKHGSEEPEDRSLLSRAWAPGAPAALYNDDAFLRIKGKPNLNLMDPVEGPTVTNSQGLFEDREHAFEATPGVRKVALIGDSLTRGWGIASDLSYPRLVESALNRDSGQKFEFINFSVSGYRATQLFATAMDVAPAYHPNLYIVPFTILAAGPEWASHVLDLLDEGRDLRYDFLKDVVRRSGIQPGDSRAVAKRKIAPYQAEVLHQILVRLKAAADKQGADVLAVLLPAVESPGLVPLRFDTVRQALKGTGIPVMDMLDCFDDVDDLETMRIHWYDAHPNIAGHEKMATEFLAKAKAQPEVWRALIGGKQ